MEKGWYVTPKYLFAEEGAPLLLGSFEKLVLPDVDAASDGKRIWFECKRKKRMLHHPATGYALYLHQSYERVQDITGSPVFVIFEDETNGLEYYGNYINNLSNQIYARNMMIQGVEHILFRYPEAFVSMNISAPSSTRSHGNE